MIAMEDSEVEHETVVPFGEGDSDTADFPLGKVDVLNLQLMFLRLDIFINFLNRGLEIDILTPSGNEADVDVRVLGPEPSSE